MLSVAYPLAPVAPETAGGAEQVLAQIDRELVQRGHRSIVVAASGSSVAGELVELRPRTGPFNDEVREEVWAELRAILKEVIHLYKPDLIHMHGLDFASYLPASEVPVLVTLHLPPAWYPEGSIAAKDGVWFNCVSDSQHQHCPPVGNLLPPIPNGVDLRQYRPGSIQRNFLLALGRICREKGTDHALDAAHAAGVPLLVAGQIYPYPDHQRYFEAEVRPRLDRRSSRFMGSISGARKRRLLAGARAVLIPSLAPETSSLVAMEALASGTPVIAYDSGALSSLIRDGVTGYIVENRQQMSEAVGRVYKIDRKSCRTEAEERFDLQRTVDAYLSVYSQFLKPRGRTPSAGIEVYQTTAELHALQLEWSGLFAQCPDAPPFLHPGWQLPWWDTFGRCELYTIALRNNGRLTALATCYRYGGRLVFVGNGITDQAGILAESDGAAQQLVQYLAQHPLDFQEIHRSSPLLVIAHEQCSVSPIVDLQQPVPADVRRNLRQARKKLEQQGEVRVQFSSCPELLGELFRLHAARWKAEGEAGVLAGADLETFHRRAAEGLAAAGMLRMHALFLNERAIGVVYAFVRNGTVYSYAGGFDPEFQKFSPGALTIEAAMEHARAAGDRYFDFLRGAEPYKYVWGAVDRPQYRILT